MRVLFDTNVLLRMTSGGDKSALFRGWLAHRFDLIMSLATLTEFRTVSNYLKVQAFVSPTITAAFVALLEKRAIWVQPDLSSPTCCDPKDTALIATAVGGRADYLVTSDRDLLDDHELREALQLYGVHVVHPQEFLV